VSFVDHGGTFEKVSHRVMQVREVPAVDGLASYTLAVQIYGFRPGEIIWLNYGYADEQWEGATEYQVNAAGALTPQSPCIAAATLAS